MEKVETFDSVVEKFNDFFRNNLKSDDFAAVLTKPPRSVIHFLPEEENRDIILVYKNKTTEVFSRKTDYVKPLSNESFDGNPLEAPFSDDTVNLSGFEIDSENNCISPIPLKFARALLSRCNLKIKPPFPVWCFCDSNNDADNVVFLSSENHEGWNIRCMASSLTFEDFNLDMLVARHKNVLNPAEIKKSQFNSIYNIHTEYFCDGKDKIRLTTLIKLTWNTLTAEPPLIESHLLTSEIITKVFVGKSENGLAFFWNELLILNEVLKMIKEKDFSNFSQKIMPYTTSIEELKNQINEPPILKNDLQHFFKRRVSSRRNEETLTALLDSFMSYKSSNLDSTDILWLLLLTCKSVEEISSCVQQVVELERSDNFKVGKFNISRVSLALSGQVAVFSSDVAQHFVEVGIEKLLKEITNIFTISGVLPLYSLKVPAHPNFSAVKNDWDKTAESWLVWISQVYCALELLANTQKILCLSSSSMGFIAENVLGNLTSSASDVKGVDWILENPYQEFKLKVPFQIVSSRIKRDPDIWVAALESEIFNGDSYCKSIFTKSSQSPFPREMDVNEMTFNLNTSMNFDKTIDFSIMGNLDTKETFWSEMLVLKNKLD